MNHEARIRCVNVQLHNAYYRHLILPVPVDYKSRRPRASPRQPLPMKATCLACGLNRKAAKLSPHGACINSQCIRWRSPAQQSTEGMFYHGKVIKLATADQKPNSRPKCPPQHEEALHSGRSRKPHHHSTSTWQPKMNSTPAVGWQPRPPIPPLTAIAPHQRRSTGNGVCFNGPPPGKGRKRIIRAVRTGFTRYQNDAMVPQAEFKRKRPNAQRWRSHHAYGIRTSKGDSARPSTSDSDHQG